MRKRYRLEVIGRRSWSARSRDHALQLAVEHVRVGESWRVTVAVGASDPRPVFVGVGRAELDVWAATG